MRSHGKQSPTHHLPILRGLEMDNFQDYDLRLQTLHPEQILRHLLEATAVSAEDAGDREQSSLNCLPDNVLPLLTHFRFLCESSMQTRRRVSQCNFQSSRSFLHLEVHRNRRRIHTEDRLWKRANLSLL